jgi:hypothetical protein
MFLARGFPMTHGAPWTDEDEKVKAVERNMKELK